MERRKFLKAATVGVAASAGIAMPSVVRAQGTITWRMTNNFGPGAPFYTTGPGSPEALAKRIEIMSGGRLKIQRFAAGELIPALEGFDAVAAGTVESNTGNSLFWSGKTFAAQYFTAVPFGMSFNGHMSWLYSGDGIKLWHEVYEPFGVVAFPLNNTGIQMTGWFRKPVEGVDDVKGLRMRIGGLASRVYSELGVDPRLLPMGEIFPALERGVIDAAEYVGPYQDRHAGMQNAAKYYYTSGWHEPATTGELLINKKSWDALPDDLKVVVETACQANVLESLAWSEAVNGDALEDLVQNQGVKALPLPQTVLDRLREVSADVLAAEVAKDPLAKKVHESYHAFKAKHDKWSNVSERHWHSSVRES